MLDKYGTAEIGVKVSGQINTEGWWEECKDKFGGNPEKFGSWQSRVDELLRKQTFNPIKQVPDGKGGSKNVIDEELRSFGGECCGSGSLGDCNVEPEWKVQYVHAVGFQSRRESQHEPDIPAFCRCSPSQRTGTCQAGSHGTKEEQGSSCIIIYSM